MSIFNRAAGALAVQPNEYRGVDLKKAITTSSAPCAIEVETAERLIDYVEDLSVLVGLMRVERMNSDQKNICFVDISGNLLRPGACTTNDDNCDTGTITGESKILNTHELKAVIPICDDFLRQNLEGAQFEDHLLRMVAAELANELDQWVLMASTTLNYHSAFVSDTIMSLDDGLYEQLQAGHVLNALSNPDGHRFITECKVLQMLQTLPVKYRSDISNMLLFMPDDMKWDWVARMKARGTALGDLAITGQIPLRFGDLDFMPVPLLPTDITSCSTGSAAGNGTFMFLANPDNLIFGVNMNITFERERKACQGRTLLVWTLAVDMLVLNEDATVLYDCMDTGNCSDCPCPS